MCHYFCTLFYEIMTHIQLYYHYTTEENFESIRTSRVIDCSKGATRTLSNEPIDSHLFCTTKDQCAFKASEIAQTNPKIVILELSIPATTNFHHISHAQRRMRLMRPGTHYVVDTYTSRYEYGIPCEIATNLLATHKIKYVVLEPFKIANHDIFMKMQFVDVV